MQLNHGHDAEHGGDAIAERDGGTGHVGLYITVNRRRFDERSGVKRHMTGAEIAALVGVPATNAVVRIEHEHGTTEVGIDQKIEIHEGERFLVTRKTVEGGYGG
jgi:hypothetical protein